MYPRTSEYLQIRDAAKHPPAPPEHAPQLGGGREGPGPPSSGEQTPAGNRVVAGPIAPDATRWEHGDGTRPRFCRSSGLDLLGASRRILPVLAGPAARHYRYLPGEALRRVADQSEITLSQLAGVSSFYSKFRHRPVGRHLVSVCNGTACHVKGAERVYDMLRNHLQITGNNDTDASGEFTVEKVFCIGCCTLAPVVRAGDHVYGPQTTDGSRS